MTRVVALVAWSNGNVTMEEKGVYEIDDALATDLIAQGLCADAATYFGGGSGGGVLEVHKVDDGTTLFTGVLPNVTGYAWRTVVDSTGTMYYVDFTLDLSGVSYDTLNCLIDGGDDIRRTVAYNDGTVSVLVGSDNNKSSINNFGYTSEEEVAGTTITLLADKIIRLDKTWQEIVDAHFSFMLIEESANTAVYLFGGYTESGYMLMYSMLDGSTLFFSASSASGYPSVVR